MKLCKDCRHCVVPVSPVSGESDWLMAVCNISPDPGAGWCESERDKGNCGPDAKLFEPREGA